MMRAMNVSFPAFGKLFRIRKEALFEYLLFSLEPILLGASRLAPSV